MHLRARLALIALALILVPTVTLSIISLDSQPKYLCAGGQILESCAFSRNREGFASHHIYKDLKSVGLCGWPYTCSFTSESGATIVKSKQEQQWLKSQGMNP
jgi:hypothetical protein